MKRCAEAAERLRKDCGNVFIPYIQSEMKGCLRKRVMYGVFDGYLYHSLLYYYYKILNNRDIFLLFCLFATFG